MSATRETARTAEARERARLRLRRQRDTLRPLGWAVTAAVVVGAAQAHPAPALHGRGLGVVLALAAFAAAMAAVIADGFADRPHEVQAAAIAVLGAAGVALAALQPRGAVELAAAVAVWMAVARLPLRPGLGLGASIAVALDVALGLGGASTAAVVAATLLSALLGLIAHFIRQSRESQERTELLTAQLEDAAAIAERGRIAGELHDVLAHSLSGAAIQLQGARKLAEREDATQQLRAAIDRAGELVRDGLANARQAVGALRGEELPSVAHLDKLVASFRDDMKVDVTLRVEGDARALPADASLALYRGAQEALTNVVRYAPGAETSIFLRYDDGRTTLCVENGAASSDGGLADVGGGRGLEGMRERLERAGGTMRAGPTANGWRVELDVPA